MHCISHPLIVFIKYNQFRSDMCPLSTSKLKIMVIMKELKKVYTYAFAPFVFSESARFFFFFFFFLSFIIL